MVGSFCHGTLILTGSARLDFPWRIRSDVARDPRQRPTNPVGGGLDPFFDVAQACARCQSGWKPVRREEGTRFSDWMDEGRSRAPALQGGLCAIFTALKSEVATPSGRKRGPSGRLFGTVWTGVEGRFVCPLDIAGGDVEEDGSMTGVSKVARVVSPGRPRISFSSRAAIALRTISSGRMGRCRRRR